MEAKDLRIGSYVKYNGIILSVIGINHPVPCKDERYANKWVIDLLCDGIISATIDEIEPVLLTEEWLVKLGFENREGMSFSNCDIFELWDLRILVNRSYKDFAFTHKRMSPPSWSICYVEYVHQLQNLYFALSGQELTIKS